MSKSRDLAALLLLLSFLVGLPGCLRCWNERILLPVSISNDGTVMFEADNAVISGEGNVVAFEAIGLSEDFADITDPEIWKYKRGQIYVRDISQARTELVSLTNGGIPVNAKSFNPSISSDGRYIAFQTDAENLRAEFEAQGWNYSPVPYQMQTYIRDRVKRKTYLVSKRPAYEDQVLFYTYNASMVPENGKVVHFAKQFPGASDNILATQLPGAMEASRFTYMTQSPARNTAMEELSLSVSNDGKVVFNSGEDNAMLPSLYLGSLNSTTITPIAYPYDIGVGGTVHNIVSYMNPDISHNGEHIVFEGRCESIVDTSVKSLVLRYKNNGRIEIVSRRHTSPERYLNGRNPAVASTGAVVLESDEGEGPIVFRPYQIYLIPETFQGGAFRPISIKKIGENYVLGDADSFNPDISDDGKRIVFTSRATNLVTGDYYRRSGGKYVYISYTERFCKWRLPFFRND